MSKFKLIVEDDAMPFGGATKIRHEFEADDLWPILANMTKFLHSSGYLDTQKRLSYEREVNLDDQEDDDLDNIEQFFGELREHAQELDKDAQYAHSEYYYDTERNK